MKENKIDTITNLFEGSEIRSIWDSEKEDYYFSVVDVISALTRSNNPRNYWNMLKKRLTDEEESELYTKCVQLKMKAKDGKFRETDVLDTEGIFRLIESVPSPKAEPFKMWLASLGKERIDEVFDPEKAIDRAIDYYRKKGYSDSWIEVRLKGILNRKKLTDVWKENGITENYEYAMLTNEIYKTWSGMKANEYKDFKGIRKESLRDNMTDIEVILTDLGEVTARDIAKQERPQGLKDNLKVAKRGGDVSKIARESYEIQTGRSAITSENAIGGRYSDTNKQLKEK
ncbi:MAG: phage antirepressor protein [Erysipelotrichaceae bacterium]|nr:phage antirepressor protein [Erysipelotrichaceae bacterium]